MRPTTALLIIALLTASTLVEAIAPESGMYWQPWLSGRGFYIEHQEGQVGLAIYAFNRDTGEAEIYVSGGFLRDDGPILPFQPSPPLPEEGLYPVHMYVGDLYKASHGQPLTLPVFPGRPAQEEKVGEIILNFLNAGSIIYSIRLDDGIGSDSGLLERFGFGHVRYSDHNGAKFSFDLRGEWVFIDQFDPEAAPMRFHFTQRLPEDAPSQTSPGQLFNLSFVDASRDARMVCATLPEGDSGTPNNPAKRSGCELFVGDELLFSANMADVGLDRIQAYRGHLPAAGANPYRRPETIIGLRVVMPPPASP